MLSTCQIHIGIINPYSPKGISPGTKDQRTTKVFDLITITKWLV